MIGIAELLHCINIDPDFDRTSCRPSGAECANRSNAIWYLSTRVTVRFASLSAGNLIT
jgi:hypothetical protein